MKEWHDKTELLARLCAALKDVVETVPKQDTYNIEAGKFLAMIVVLDDWNRQAAEEKEAFEAAQKAQAEEDAKATKKSKGKSKHSGDGEDESEEADG